MKKFIIELIVKRLLKKNPKFFLIIQVISTICGLIAGIPHLLVKLGIELPPMLMVFESKAVAVAAMVAIVIAQLPNEGPSDPTEPKQ